MAGKRFHLGNGEYKAYQINDDGNNKYTVKRFEQLTFFPSNKEYTYIGETRNFDSAFQLAKNDAGQFGRITHVEDY
jgi:hypothetical protein